MNYAHDTLDTLSCLPPWVTAARAETSEDAAFLSGAALAHLRVMLNGTDVPLALLRQRLAVRAAEVCGAHAGRVERVRDLRDAVLFLQPGGSAGPAGEAYLSWQRAVERRVSANTLRRAMPTLESAQINTWLSTGPGVPVARAAVVLQAVSETGGRDFTTALIVGEAALAKAIGWSHVTPLITLGLRRLDFRLAGDEFRMACHRAVTAAVPDVIKEAADLSRRVRLLRDVAPKLRAKGADEAIEMFMTRDAVAPTSLTSLRSGRSARRFCDRLVALGAIRELTGRETFRLYGV